MKPDPPVPADSRCVVCGGKRKLNQKRLYREHARVDPFCSTVCARHWHGVSL